MIGVVVIMMLSLASMSCWGFSTLSSVPFLSSQRHYTTTTTLTPLFMATPTTTGVPAPTFDGKLVFPLKVLKIGLRNHHNVAAVYAVLNQSYRRSDGEWAAWEACEYVGVTKNLNGAVESLASEEGVAAGHVRAMSFQYPQRDAMDELAGRWMMLSLEHGGAAKRIPTNEDEWKAVVVKTDSEEEQRRREMEASKYLYDQDFEDDFDDDDDDDEDDDMDDEDEETVVSPFSADATTKTTTTSTTTAPTTPTSTTTPLVFSQEEVDRVLEQVRPYLISDGGNVSVYGVKEETKDVYLVLEGACGSCPSSTVTMQMGIERVLREAFVDLGQVLRVEPTVDAPTELTQEAVDEEVKRLRPTMAAMGAVMEVLEVDPIGMVEIRFRGPNKIRHGLELALLDVPFVKHVKFVS